jgi:aminopeptidase N
VQQNLLRKMRQSALAQADAGPIYLGYRLGHIQANGSIFRATVYNKSAVVLHMLRQLIGEAAFTAGLRRFYREHRFQKAGTDDLQHAFEAEVHRPLGRFFERWVMGSSLPRVHVAARIDASSTFATVTIEQRGDVFDLPVSLAVEYANGSTETIVVPVWDATSEHRIPLKGPARRVFADPDQIGLATFVR